VFGAVGCGPGALGEARGRGVAGAIERTLDDFGFAWERAIAMLCAALGGLVAAPLTQIQTVEQMMAQQRNGPPPDPKYRPKSKPSWSMPRSTSSTALCSSSRFRCSAI